MLRLSNLNLLLVILYSLLINGTIVIYFQILKYFCVSLNVSNIIIKYFHIFNKDEAYFLGGMDYIFNAGHGSRA
jgi:hypothetical protein